MKNFVLGFSLLLTCSTVSFAQNTNSSTTTNSRPRTTTNPPPAAKAQPKPTATPAKQTATPAPAADTVDAAFDKIIEGIQKANVDLVTNGYLNSTSLACSITTVRLPKVG